MPAIPRMFGQQLWNLAVFSNFDILFLVMGFICMVDERAGIFSKFYNACILSLLPFSQ